VGNDPPQPWIQSQGSSFCISGREFAGPKQIVSSEASWVAIFDGDIVKDMNDRDVDVRTDRASRIAALRDISELNITLSTDGLAAFIPLVAIFQFGRMVSQIQNTGFDLHVQTPTVAPISIAIP
jgi:adenylylsulfate kinase-like enzyme